MNKIALLAMLFAFTSLVHANEPTELVATRPSTLGFEFIRVSAPATLITSATISSTPGSAETPVSVSREQAYLASVITKEDGTVVLVPAAVNEGFTLKLRENPGQQAIAELGYSKIDSIKNAKADEVGVASVATHQIVVPLVPGKQVKDFKIEGKRYKLSLDYTPGTLN